MVQQTHWFYERARGQFINKQANLKPSDQKKFLLQNPKAQMFTKTDLAKYIRTFAGLPHEVSKGAQKNFSLFAAELGKQWDKNDGNDFNELWFKRLIGQAILFRKLDSLVLKAEWYTGYKANIVTYTLANFSKIVRECGRYINFLKVWEKQVLPDAMGQQLLEIAEKVHHRLLNPPANATSNVSEWAKYDACWTLVQTDKVSLRSDIKDYLLDHEQKTEFETDAGRTDAIQGGIHTQTYVVEKGPEHWKLLRDWNEENGKLTGLERGILDVACEIPRKIPSEKQSKILIDAEKRAIVEGFFFG
jgi:hypothetical protein